jgi:hypothetical protein
VAAAFAADLAAAAGVPVDRGGRVTRNVDELLLIGVPFCVLPIVSLDGEPVSEGSPGPVGRALRQAWSSAVGVELDAQLAGLAARP